MAREMPEDFARLLDDPQEPFEEYRVSKRRVAIQLALGPVFAVVGILLTLAVVLTGFHGHQLLHWSFLLIGLGPWTIWRTLRVRNSAVLYFPSLGFLIAHQRGVDAFRWRELVGVTLDYRLEEKIPFADSPGPRQLLLRRHPSALFGLRDKITFRTVGGTVGSLSGLLDEFDILGRTIQARLFKLHWETLLQRFEAGQRLQFGEIGLDREAIYLPKRKPLRWSDFRDLRLSDRTLVIRRKGSWFVAYRSTIGGIENPHLMVSLIEIAARRAAVTPTLDVAI